MKNHFVLFFSIVISLLAFGQEKESRWVSAKLVDGDTIPVVFMNMFVHTEARTFKSKAEQRKFSRLERNVTIVYPYAKLASELLHKYEDEILAEETQSGRKKYYKQVEKELRAKYEKELMDMTVSQGRILIKLIDRETGNTSYELVSNLRGELTALFFQGIARIFGHNLKSEYNPDLEDRMIEDIILLIERGELKLANG